FSHFFFQQTLSCGVLWNNESIYYTYRNNTTNGFFQIYGSNLSLSEMSNGSTIHQIIPDYLGNVMIKMKNNYLFYTKSELRGLVQLPDWIDETKKMVLYLNPSASVYTLLIDGSNIYRQTYPLELEIFSSTLMSEFSCSIIAFLHNMHFSIYYLDMGDELTFWSQIVFEENVDIGTYLEVYRPELLLLRGSTVESATAQRQELTLITFLRSFSRMHSSQWVLLHCANLVIPSHHKAAYIFCPLTTAAAALHTCLLIHCIALNPNVSVLFMCLCCFIEKYHMFYRYDGDKYVRRVEANFILWEMKGRSDYGYTSSMKEEGCLHKAQSWPMMLNASKNSTLDEIWGPQNYRSCFVFDENSTEEGLYEQYQILNMTSTNSIAWSPSHSGIYVFRVRIVDPNYRLFSFVNVKKKESDISSVTLYSFFIICIFVAFLILSYFRYTEIFQDLKHADEKKASPDEQEN
uniref:Cation channel sperm-associated protein subunit epsilon n=1 Tax=Nothoprocta perdicaria TaxID=30464 RepID=A0A8C6ZBU1_NOTPE